MGPRSKEAICNVLGHLIDELQQQREVIRTELGELRSLLEHREDGHNADTAQINRRLGVLERRAGISG